MKTNKNKIPVIYVVGAGHSGSTLLDLIMGSHSQIFGTGELHHYFFKEGYKNNFFCCCGKLLSSCDFWKKVFGGIRLDIKLQAYRKKFDFLFKKDRYIDAHNNDVIDIEKYLGLNEKIFENILKHSGKKVIFESSKHPDRLELLLKSRKLNVVILHLVRDVRGVAWSYRNKYPNLLGGARLWFRRNFKAEIVKKRNKANCIFIKYKDFAENPKDVLTLVLEGVGLSFEPQMMNFRENINHQVAGNQKVRLGRLTEITPDVRWKKEMRFLDRLKINLIFGWFNLYYRFKKSSGLRNKTFLKDSLRQLRKFYPYEKCGFGIKIRTFIRVIILRFFNSFIYPKISLLKYFKRLEKIKTNKEFLEKYFLSKEGFKEMWESKPRETKEQVESFYYEHDKDVWRQIYMSKYDRHKRCNVVKVFNLVSSFKKTNINILDYGCGCAVFSHYLYERGYKNITLADIKSSTFEFVQKAFKERFNYIEIKDLKPLKENYDVILLISVLAHVFNPLETIKHVIEHLKPGGILVLDYEKGVELTHLAVANDKREEVMNYIYKKCKCIKQEEVFIKL